MDDELENKETSHQATRNADAKAVTDTTNSLVKGNGKFNNGYPQESENGKTELGEKYLLATDGAVKRKPQNTNSDQPKPKDQSKGKLGRFLGRNSGYSVFVWCSKMLYLDVFTACIVGWTRRDLRSSFS